jgi:hypothetical protein
MPATPGATAPLPRAPTGREKRPANRHPPAAPRQAPKPSPTGPTATGPAPTSANRRACPDPAGTGNAPRCQARPSAEVQTTGSIAVRPGRSTPPTATQPPGTASTSNPTVRPAPSEANPGAPSTSVKRLASTETQAAAPLLRVPTITHPAAPAPIRATCTARGPPKSSNGAVTSPNPPSGSCRQLLVRGLPWTPPVRAPRAATRPAPQAAAKSTARWP